MTEVELGRTVLAVRSQLDFCSSELSPPCRRTH